VTLKNQIGTKFNKREKGGAEKGQNDATTWTVLGGMVKGGESVLTFLRFYGERRGTTTPTNVPPHKLVTDDRSRRGPKKPSMIMEKQMKSREWEKKYSNRIRRGRVEERLTKALKNKQQTEKLKEKDAVGVNTIQNSETYSVGLASAPLFWVKQVEVRREKRWADTGGQSKRRNDRTARAS